MGYYLDNKYYTIIDVSEWENNNNYITIVNNEEIIFTFKNFRQVDPVGYIYCEKDNNEYIESEKNNLKGIILEKYELKVEDCFYKIIIDFKDGIKETHTKPIKDDDSSWLVIPHVFRFQDNEFTQEKGNIEIFCYNLYKDEPQKITIPFKVQASSSQEMGIELHLISASLDNKKNISYVFNEISNNQLILAKMKNHVKIDS